MDSTTLPPPAPAALSERELGALRQRLLRQARLALPDTAQAEDLVQDTLIAVLRQWPSYRGDAALSTWAIAILRHKVADWYRSPVARRETQLPDESDAALDAALAAQFDASGTWREPVPEWQQPDSQAERRQMMQVLEGCIGCLPVQTQRVFVMREWLGFETDEIRARLGLSADNVRTVLHRARMALRDCMQRRWFGGGQGAARV